MSEIRKYIDIISEGYFDDVIKHMTDLHNKNPITSPDQLKKAFDNIANTNNNGAPKYSNSYYYYQLANTLANNMYQRENENPNLSLIQNSKLLDDDINNLTNLSSGALKKNLKKAALLIFTHSDPSTTIGKKSKASRSPETTDSYDDNNVNTLEFLEDAYLNKQNYLDKVINARSMNAIIRRYQTFNIEQTFKAHYYEIGADTTTFEHVVPIAAGIRLFVNGNITALQCLNIPTCRLSVANELLLKKLAKTTPNPKYFWKRYTDVGIDVAKLIQTIDKKLVDPNMTLADHYKLFGIN